MDKFKKITLYALTAALLATSCPWHAFAERNQPVAPPPPVTAPGGGGGSSFGNKNGSDNNNTNVKNGKHRYNLDTIGLDKDGKKSLENTPKSIDHQEYMAILYNWSGLKMGPDGNAYDRKTGKLVYAPPIVKYDVVISYKDKKTNQDIVDVYSMFGFKGFENYQDQYQGKQVNRHDMTSYHQPNYYDFSYKNYNIRNLLGKPIMGHIPKDAKFEIIEYSKSEFSNFGE
ncbi:hypothetical protein [Aedoeadaptatus coxii]|uniref:hypothetical protein n=1 Tax=Aedoeadaptatus coxii TaxID=755172 RepID=UPI002AD361AD|nr:hypothetical protein [Peptoniphilus coxii]